MASLGTLAAELKLEGAAGMTSGLRAAGGAVSSLGNVLGGVRAPLAQLDGALRAVQSGGAGISAAVAPVDAAAAAIRQLPGQAGRAAAALQTLARAGAGMRAAFARPDMRSRFADAAGRLPAVRRAVRLPGQALSPAGETSRRQIGLGQARARTAVDGLVLGNIPVGRRPQRDDAAGDEPRMAAGGNFWRGLRGALEPFKSGLRGGGGAAGVERGASEGAAAGARLAALLGHLHAAAARSRTSTANAGAQIGAMAGRAGEGDRLARVGGFIGGGGGPALDFHRRTAAATEKTAAGIQTLLQRLPSAEKPLTALWA